MFDTPSLLLFLGELGSQTSDTGTTVSFLYWLCLSVGKHSSCMVALINVQQCQKI